MARFVPALGLLALGLAMTGCGGGGGATPSSPGGVTPSASGGTLSADASKKVPGCPPSSPGTYHEGLPGVGLPLCPEITLQIAGGHMISAADTGSSPPPQGFALVYAADGTFLYADSHASPLRKGAAMEVDVLTVPQTSQHLEDYEWDIFGDHRSSFFVNVLQLRSIQQVDSRYVIPGATPSYFLLDGNGNNLGPVTNTHGLDVPLTQFATAKPPLTLLTFSNTTAEYQLHCGDCWEVLFH
jgi:hypothetical protein